MQRLLTAAGFDVGGVLATELDALRDTAIDLVTDGGTTGRGSLTTGPW